MMINLTIDGKELSVPKGTTVYHAAKQLGIDIPIFCYQDRMPPFGACRMCLVEVEKMNKLQASCALEVAEGMVVKTQSTVAKEGREGILELLLINHPLDCPICDKGGECPLQDQTLKHGPGESRFYEEKRHFTKALPLGPTLMLDRERCIVCARCTRFGDIVAGDHALEMKERGFRTEVGTPGNRLVESKFIGNTISICPVGALTSQVYRFRARPWDNHSIPSTCTLCPVGCSLNIDSRDGQIVRTRSRENKLVNDIWLCDKGWFGYEFVSNAHRLQQPLIRKDGKLTPASWEEALNLIVSQIKFAKPTKKIAGLGGNPLTTEENYLFQRLIREVAEANHVDHRIGTPHFDSEQERLSPGMEISLGECESLSFVILLGLDLTEEFPLIWLRLKQAINKGAKVLFMGNFSPEIASYLTKIVLHPPGKELENWDENLPLIEEWVSQGKSGAIFVGQQYLINFNRPLILDKLWSFRQSHSNLTLNLLEGSGNSQGARFAGMRPDLGPLNQKIEEPGLHTLAILEAAAKKDWEFLYVVGANLAKKYPAKLWRSARENIKFMVVQDLFLTETALDADVVLPSLSFIEKSGTFINIENRIQTLHQGKEIPENSFSDASIFMAIAEKLGIQLSFEPAFLDALSQTKVFHTCELRTSLPLSESVSNEKLKAVFAPALFDEGIRMKHDPHLIQLVKEPRLRMHPNEAKKRGIMQGDTVRLTTNKGSLQAKIKWDGNVAEQTVIIPLGFDLISAHDLDSNLINGLPIDIQLIESQKEESL
ncbi:NADH-quinone oxidoreductase subunit NuoG [Candidatus Protochlamydia sp. W-9]|uniref:NADH-quinone oxidoreductase subunit NuoG n=1 Tax=Candidatus Protochlamydia sp. W-9 TaxID=1785087 RepID=UPI00096A4340|nr:NADH-quinone oxidoreductase subunit NuoG [Candidatus Protochlamydia sp. W-9]